MIASAFACHPDLILLDEPTTALDVLTGARILELFRRLRTEIGMAALYISHDLALVSRVADRIAVIRAGQIVEEATGSDDLPRAARTITRACWRRRRRDPIGV